MTESADLPDNIEEIVLNALWSNKWSDKDGNDSCSINDVIVHINNEHNEDLSSDVIGSIIYRFICEGFVESVTPGVVKLLPTGDVDTEDV